jgi:hypothetical protein
MATDVTAIRATSIFVFMFPFRVAYAASDEKGVPYSRSLTGTGMPSKERFQTRPMGRVFKRRLLSRNFPFRE